MEKDTKINEKIKIKLKADTKIKTKLILQKKFIINEKSNTLLLNKTVDEKPKNKQKKINQDNKIKVISPNILEINNQNLVSKKILSLSQISKSLGGRPILKNVSFSLEKGKILGLLGPNGAGKSTLFNIIVGKIYPDYGFIKLNNETINNLPIHKRALKGISLLEQHKGLFENMTAYENLYAVLELYIEDKNKIDAKIFQLLSYFGLQYLSEVKARNMSGGEYKKISTLQRVCNKDIKILLLDEPMAALDPLSISSIKKFILELRDIGLSVIITDHNFFAIQDILDNCIIIRDGNIMVEGPPEKVIKDNKAIKYYLGSGFKI